MCLTNREDCTTGNDIKNLPGSSLSDVSAPLSLPVSPDANWPAQMRLQRREGYLGASHWIGVKEQAESRGVRPSSIVLTAYAKVLSAWSGSERFDFSVINRSAMTQHSGLSDYQGNTVSLSHVKIDFRQAIPFWKRALRLQQQIRQGVSTPDGDGIHVSSTLCDRRDNVDDIRHCQ